jgi:signal transduction histidine kinase
MTVRTSARFQLEVDPTGLTVTADPVLAERAIVNVLRAALKHCRRNDVGHLRVRGGPNGPSVWIATPPRGLPRESTLSESSNGASHDPASSGFGFRDLTLYLSVRLMDLLGGQLWEGEVAEDSARFLIAFPRDSEATRKSEGG